MPFCPQCGYEYEEDITVCPECNEVLELGELLLCEFCSERVEEAAKFCPHCGMLQGNLLSEDEEIECENHPQIEAIGMCVVCGKPVCGDCAVKRQGKILCENDEHIKIAQNWAVVYTTGTEYEAQMVRANLENAGFPCVVFSQRDHAYFLTVGDMAVVNVMVPKNRLFEAQEFLRRMDLFAEGEDDFSDEE